MNDRYLYRAKRNDNGEWASGSYINTFTEDKECTCAGIYKENHWIVEKNGNMVAVDASTICQCVRRKDEEGTLIFEHDIVSYLDGYSTDNGFSEGYPVGEVLWDDETLSFQVTERLSAESYEVLDGGDCIKVLGNRFDNPELL